MDIAHKYTDARIAEVEKELKLLYIDAHEKASKKIEKRLLKITLITNPEQRQAQFYLLQNEKAIVDSLANDILNVNQHAVRIINNERLNVFAENRNYTGFSIESQANLNIDWSIYNRDAVARLLRNNPELLPEINIDIPADLRWNQKKINGLITSAIIQGTAIPELAAQFRDIVDMNETSAVRNARTALGAAQSAGRLDGLHDAERKGIKMLKIWSAVFDGRTRHTHRVEDGTEIGIDELFPTVGVMYPCDPNGKAEEVYNCRCSLTNRVAGVDRISAKRDGYTNEIVIGMNYEKWVESHRTTPTEQSTTKNKKHSTDAKTPPITEKSAKKATAQVPKKTADEKEKEKINQMLNANTKFTLKELGNIKRKELEKISQIVAVKNAKQNKLTEKEALERSIALMKGNTDSQLRKYINKYGKG